ncbi:MAG TPA: hypothetical protein VID26_07355 [Candidatus Limnocylindrales bacterium]|jgi:hypothetical protein
MVATERRPVHLLGIVGLSAAIYAVNLAVITELQAAGDSQVTAAQAGNRTALDVLRVTNARVAGEVQAATGNLRTTNSLYLDATQALISLEARLAGLGKSASALQALPALPSVSSGSLKAPVIHATTGASGAKP